jgi:hypothetical protein
MDCEIPILEKSTTPMLMYEGLPDFMIFTCLYCKNKTFFYMECFDLSNI